MRMLVLANQRLVDAQIQVAIMYEQGIGVVANEYEAARWYIAASETDRNAALRWGVFLEIGDRYWDGRGVAQDYLAAFQYYEAAAELCDAVAWYRVGYAYLAGFGVPQNYAMALTWLAKAADFEVPDAIVTLAAALAADTGAGRDLIGSYMWYSIAIAMGFTDLVPQRLAVGSMMSAQQVQEAQRMAADWWEAHR